jgi:CubicO group peptidase (beta-lactamase class C family)
MINLLEFAWLIAFYALLMIVVFALTFFAGRIVIIRLSSKRPRRQAALSIVWGLLVVAGLVLLTSNVKNLPAPKWPRVKAEAAGSMRATAGDMARFLIELSNPKYLGLEMATQLQTPQIELHPNLSWGLGPGIQYSSQGDALWQWGQHLDFQSIMIIYPEHGFGVVVCTNNDLLNPDVAMEIAHRALGGKIETIRRAIHLEFNYREDQ